MKNYAGMKWGQLTKEEKIVMLKNANAIDGESGNDMIEDGECIVDLHHPFSVSGRLQDGEIIIDDAAEIYNPCGEE